MDHEGLRPPAREGQSHDDGARGHPLLVVGPGHAGEGQAHIGAEDVTGPLGHGPGGRLGHHGALGHTQHGVSVAGGVAALKTQEPGAGAGADERHARPPHPP